jgi:aryl-alcohol dehydrogenase-like predicted oxidoreductase
LRRLDSALRSFDKRAVKYRTLGRTPFEVSEISFGAWAIGKSCWGDVNDGDSMRALHAAADAGVNFFDTADVYGSGLSEQLCARLKRERSEPIIIATKVGRGANPHTRANYTPEKLSFFVERSLGHLGTDSIDLLQLHCPPPECYYQPEIIDAVERLVQAGKVRYWGVSVERVEEALKSIEYPGCQSIQIIYNVLRQRPAELLIEQTRKRRVGIIARVPLASGLLTGKLSKQSRFADDDHRTARRRR